MGSTDTSLYPATAGNNSPFSKANGVNYSRHADITLVTKKEANADIPLIATIAKMMRVFGWNSDVMAAAQTSGLEVCLGTTNAQVSLFAANNCSTYVTQITPYADTIKLISVGNEVFNETGLTATTVASAIQNLHTALKAASIDIPVTTDVIWANVGHGQASQGYAPSSGIMTTDGTTICNMLTSIYGSDAVLLASFYPYLDVKGWVASNGAPFANNLLPYVLFQNATLGPADNQFDSDYSTLRYALKSGSFEGITVLVSETGWATDGFSPYSTAANLQTYLSGYESWRTTNDLGLTTFWFEMFDESSKPAGDEQSYGLYDEKSKLKTGVTIPSWL